MKLALVLAASLTLIACQNTPVIGADYVVEEVKNDVAVVHSNGLTLEVEFDADRYKDGNGFEFGDSNHVEINQIIDIKVFNEDGETENYILQSEDVPALVDAIEDFIRG